MSTNDWILLLFYTLSTVKFFMLSNDFENRGGERERKRKERFFIIIFKLFFLLICWLSRTWKPKLLITGS